MSTSPAPAAKEARLHALDGLRGIAAVAVFFFHAPLLDPLPSWMRLAITVSPLGALFNGPGAVHVFFVLSGYVLALTLQSDDRAGRIPRYYVRRVFRIHPPYMAAVLLAFAVSGMVAGIPHESLDVSWGGVPASRLPIALAFPSMAFGLLPVGWSLYVEMAMSAFFPLLFWMARRVHPAVPLALSLLFLSALDPRLSFLRFTIDFALGIVLRLEADGIARRMQSLPASAPALAALAGLALLQAPLLGSLSTLGDVRLERGHTPLAVTVFALAAGLLVVGTIHSPLLHRWLSRPLARFFGRVSYSFYLVHETVLLGLSVVASPWAGSVAFAVGITLVGFAVSVAASELGWRLVEAPSIGAGRALIRAGGALFGGARAR